VVTADDRDKKATRTSAKGPCPQTPVATYRIQFSRDFTFRQARSIIDYLSRLGISDCYASPLLKSRSGSTHGYDVVSHDELNPELGGEGDFIPLVEDLHRRGMGLVLDIVPNHMSADESNLRWLDLLEYGRYSTSSGFFDVRRSGRRRQTAASRLLLPVLGGEYGTALREGQLRIVFSPETGRLAVRVHGSMSLPLTPSSYTPVLKRGIRVLGDASPRSSEELRRLAKEFDAMPTPDGQPPAEGVRGLHSAGRRLEKKLSSLCADDQRVTAALEEAMDEINSRPMAADRILEGQFYRLAFWRRAATEINYRRFLSVNDLVGIRVEEPSVFDASHKLILDMIARGAVTGLRVDHSDGLWDPEQYFVRLQARAKRASREADGREKGKGGAWRQGRRTDARQSFYLVAEKILRGGEELPRRWQIDGTTGYDFMNLVNGLFVLRTSSDRLKADFEEFIEGDVGTGERGRPPGAAARAAPVPPLSFEDIAYVCRKQSMASLTRADVGALATCLQELSGTMPGFEDIPRRTLARSIEELAARFPIYRTYASPSSPSLTGHEAELVKEALDRAEQGSKGLDPMAWRLLRRVFLTRPLAAAKREGRGEGSGGGGGEDEGREEEDLALRFIMMFQQFTPVVMVEGVENTAFYRYNVLSSLEEVGGDPGRFGTSIGEFHAANAARSMRWPHSMLASSTHDTKRGEDVRARINVLSEVPAEWRSAVERWAKLNVKSKSGASEGAPAKGGKGWTGEGKVAPGRSDEYLFYQTLVGAWPLGGVTPDFVERMVAYMQKASKEAKLRTSWLHPDDPYSAAMDTFVRGVLKDEEFLSDFESLNRKAVYFGMLNSLAQLLLKLTCPGVPDTYQGTELWDYSLVDPDNRRAVDFSKRKQMLERLEERMGKPGSTATGTPTTTTAPAGLARGLWEHPEDGAVKMFVLSSTLRYRQAHRQVFEGAYIPLAVTGPRGDHVCAFARESREGRVVVAVPRFLATLAGGGDGGDAKDRFPFDASVWGDTKLLLDPRGSAATAAVYRNLFTGDVLVPGPLQRTGIRGGGGAVTEASPSDDGAGADSTPAADHGGPTTTIATAGATMGLDVADIFRDFPVAILYEETRER
jgi:(1->4)-alpha-D-glucan 1-alpha-D-glucosylmutase